MVKGIIVSAVMAGALPIVAGGVWFGDVEAGAVFSGYNDVRVPGDGGSDFSLSGDLAADPSLYYRFRFGYGFGDHHEASLLVAPLTVRYEGDFNRAIVFQGETFPPGRAVTATYRFDSYRATYRYNFKVGTRCGAGAGATLKIRDAAIDLREGGLAAETTNTGVVPLINFRFDVTIRPGILGFLEGDALAAPQGRAEDVAVGVAVRPTDRAAVKVLYRVLEGGADNAEVYNFALFHYGGAALTLYL